MFFKKLTSFKRHFPQKHLKRDHVDSPYDYNIIRLERDTWVVWDESNGMRHKNNIWSFTH